MTKNTDPVLTQVPAALDAIVRSARTKGPAPVEKWNPPYCGDIGLEIRSDGSWMYQGTPIARRALDACPWDERTFRYHKVVFPQLATWLPEDERDQLRFEFAAEVERIELLMAA